MKRQRFVTNESTGWRELLAKNFVGGLLWGLGTVIGATLVLSLLINALHKLDFIPMVADFVLQIQTAVENRK